MSAAIIPVVTRPRSPSIPNNLEGVIVTVASASANVQPVYVIRLRTAWSSGRILPASVPFSKGHHVLKRSRHNRAVGGVPVPCPTLPLHRWHQVQPLRAFGIPNGLHQRWMDVNSVGNQPCRPSSICQHCACHSRRAMSQRRHRVKQMRCIANPCLKPRVAFADAPSPSYVPRSQPRHRSPTLARPPAHRAAWRRG